MKKQLFLPVLALAFMFSIAIIFDSCKKEEPCPTVNYTAIDQAIADAQQKHDGAVEGTGPGEYPPPAKNDLQQAIDVAKSVRTKNCVTQEELTTAENALKNAVTVFESKKIPECPDVDYTEIDQALTNAQQIHDNAIEGSLSGEYLPGSKAEFQQRIDTVSAVRNKPCVTQDELDEATSFLAWAIIEFELNMIHEIDYTLIDQTIADAQQRHDNAVEGSNPGEYLPGAKTELQQAIDAAQLVRDKPDVTQFEINAAVVTLNAAIAIFESKKIPDFDKDIVAHWLFNGNGNDASGNGHDGTASAGHANWGGGMPELAADRHGNADYCYKFVDGGNFVVPNGPAFIPDDLTISVWMNLYETWAHSYFISNDIWNTWKFQVQDANKLFFTAHFLKDDGSGEEAWVDHDSGLENLDLDNWYHVVLTYTSGKMIFYIDGEEVQEWDDFPTGTLIEPHAGVDLCIGQALPTDIYSNIPGDPYEWQEWLGYFKGYLDDMRFYDVVLTDAQVKTLYDFENVTTIE